MPLYLRLLRVLRRRQRGGAGFNAERSDRAAHGSIHGDKGHFIGKARRRGGAEGAEVFGQDLQDYQDCYCGIVEL